MSGCSAKSPKGRIRFGNENTPLAKGQRREHVVGEVGGDFDHAAGVAGWADAPALAGERDESLVGASVAADAREAMG